ncbi:vacuolar-type H+-ATPase subunit H [Streptomyces sp. SAI-135]|uniref:ATP synthase F0 subunit B n=1 Tax=unclassified Streptomyces TaxID=2593676 RepID=UPI002474CF6E|nr:MULTISPECIES: ATP synthase F0 subunit B [unclassified Streptomyces]MDH6516242.1 vacuolar-type H+-ATPase subunit H [Streptomyces sp. SAI-090]MDH6548440.1 vacuolar-type H+-ATPase subunit H [Streptomyces sp. SAI-041]MDH6619667.1 vacuolar-type H+-ATPase subunit H [Streptomyces sp. SAI-135]
MDVQKKLDEIVATVSGARSMPMSASVMVNRAELLAMLDELRQALPGSLAQAQELIGDREQMVEQARQEAERIISTAHAERGSLISDTEIARRSQAEADRILNEARQEAEEVRAEADDYVDSKLANFEVVLTKTLGSVGRGREKLLGTGPGLDENGYEDEDAPERSHDPETLRKDADSYVDAKLGAFEAVLAKTLEAVGRGRQKLHGRIATDDLGALADNTSTVQHSSDADYLADLAALAEQDSQAAAQAPAEQPDYSRQPAYGYQQQTDAYAAYQQQPDPYNQQDPYSYQQADPYAYQGYDQQQAAYDQQHQAQQAQHAQAQHAHAQHAQQSYALDETSLFDTGMITPEQLRAYEQGRGQ